jgi:two-component SAPR family response regulator
MRTITDKEYDSMFDEIERLREGYAEALNKIMRYKSLLGLAADALSYQLKFINEHCCDGYPSCSELIAELRKAGQNDDVSK